MPNKILEVRVEKSDGNSLSSGFVARVFDEEIVPIDDDVRSFGISLAEKLMEIAEKDNCGFLLIDAIQQKEFRYAVYYVKDLWTGEYKLDVLPQVNLPMPWTINKRLYNWFTGRSKFKS